ncbi:hypothetical protein D1007_40796 [Hordeum vulgare]|nr:hypothetical protein D1007_40796 [Hordeum vulgare]
MAGARAYTGARPHAHVVALPVSVTTSTSSHDGGEEARLMQHVMEDSMTTHDEPQWPGLDRAMALSAADDVAIPEQMEEEECPTPPLSPERDASPREEVMQASFKPAHAHQGPPAYVDLVSDGDDDDTDGQ